MEMKLKDIFNNAENKIKEINNKAKEEIKEINQKAKFEIDKLAKPALKATVELFAEIGWNKWSKQELESEEQYARLQKAFTDKMELVSVDYDTKCGQVYSSMLHNVTGNGCSCKDCSIRRKPCKHMYFLAIRLAESETRSEDLQLKLNLDNQNSTNDTNTFLSEFGMLGCCSLFRDCSHAGHCLQNDDYFKQCAYRKNLESGKVFYTEKADRFSQERYDYIENFHNSLTEDEKNAFNEIVIYFEKTKRGCESCLCLSSQEIENIITKCNVFEPLPTKELVSRIFDAGLILNKRAAAFHNKYSKLPAPKLEPLLPILPKSASKEEKEKRLKANQKINSQNLKTWERHYMSDTDLQLALSKQFLYFQKKYSLELNEFFVMNFERITKKSSHLVFFDSALPQNFKDKIV